MTWQGLLQIALFLIVLLLIVRPLGTFLYFVFDGKRTFLTPVMQPIERIIYKAGGVKSDEEMDWKHYAIAVLVFSGITLLLSYLQMRIQAYLPLNPAGESNVGPGLAFNTAVSFTTNTNWQAYAGESTMSYLTQMMVMTYHNFISAGIGIAVAVALIRGLARKSTENLGNFWVDLVRCILYVLLPVGVVYAIFLIWQGVPDNFNTYVVAKTLEGATQIIAQGPVASQEAIKLFGTNGGGFFNANSAHPYENPTAFSNIIENLSLITVGAALLYTFGKWVDNTRQGWAIIGACLIILVPAVLITYNAEASGNPLITAQHIQVQASNTQPGGNMEGKEVRFGIADSALFAVMTTATSDGAFNSFHDSFTPMGGLVPLALMALGEVVIGGVGAGFYGMIVFVLATVFIAGLMVGRTPEYLGKKIEAADMKMVMLVILLGPVIVLGFSALAVVLPAGVAGILNPGPHGLTEILYAFTSAHGNNGSAFAGLSVNTTFYNSTLGIVMLLGRFFQIVPTLALAGFLAKKKSIPASVGTFPTTSLLFSGLLVGVIVIIAGLTYFPAYSLGPIVEQYILHAGHTYVLTGN